MQIALILLVRLNVLVMMDSLVMVQCVTTMTNAVLVTLCAQSSLIALILLGVLNAGTEIYFLYIYDSWYHTIGMISLCNVFVRCKEGFKVVGTQCVDVDECRDECASRSQVGFQPNSDGCHGPSRTFLVLN